jgi:hypothetical protein
MNSPTDDEQPLGLAYLRYRFEEGRKAFARGEAVPTDPDALTDDIEKELGLDR